MTNHVETKEKKGKKRYIFIFAAIIVLIFIIIWAEPIRVYENFLLADIKYIGLALLVNLISNLLLLNRWYVLYTPQSKNVHFLDSSKIYMISQATNQIAPMGSGEITRGLIGSRFYNVHFSKTIAAVVIERVEDILFFLTVTIIGLILFVHGRQFYLELAIFIFFAIFAFIFFIRPHTMDGIMKRFEGFFKRRGKYLQKLSKKLISSWESFKESMFAYHEKKLILFSTILITIAIWFTDALTQYLIFLAFGIEINYFYVLGISCVSFVVGAISFLPGGLGAREGTFAYLTTIFGISKATGLGIALVYKAIVYLIFSAGAVIAISTLPPRIKKNNKSKDAAK